MDVLTQTLEHKQRKYQITADTKNRQVTVNGCICDVIEYDDRAKALYAILPDEHESLMILVYKKKCYIFEYDPHISLKDNAGEYIFVRLNTLGKILLAVLFIIPFATIYVVLDKSLIYAMCLAALLCTSTLLVTSIVKMPTIEQKKKRIIYLVSSFLIAAIISVMGLLIYYQI